MLIADDDSAIRTVLSQAMSRAGYNVRSTSTAASLWHWVAEGQGDVVVTDVVLPDENAFDVMPRIKKIRPRLPVIVMSAKNTIMTAITAAERGAYDYLPKPFDLNVLVALVARALDQAERQASAPPSLDARATCRSSAVRSVMQDIYRIIARLTQTDLTVIIEGESGTGKELVARAIHDYGKRRRRGPFVAVNMAAIPRELIESELFGHEKGAFTGATTARARTLRAGRVRHAVPRRNRRHAVRSADAACCASCSRANIRPSAARSRSRPMSGSSRPRIAISSSMIARGQFREDLFFRLNVVPIRLPPLRERSNDIPDLVRHFLAASRARGLAAQADVRRRARAPPGLSLARQCPRT